MHKTAEKQPAAYRPNEAFELLGGSRVCSRATFYNAIKRNQIPHVRLGGKRILIPRVAFEKWLAAEGFTGGKAA